MRDRQLYAKILGIEAPWRVEEVELDAAGGELTVRVGYHGQLRCPECGEATPGYDTRERP
jgi:transposase